MHLGKVQKLAQFLMRPEVSIAEVSKFLALEIFGEWKPSTVYAGEITDDGYIAPLGAFGLPAEVLINSGNISLAEETPLTDSVKRDQIILLEREEAFERYPVLLDYKGIPEKWDSYLTCPTLPYGVFALTLNSVPIVDEELESLLRTVGALVSLHISRSALKVDSFKPKNRFSRATRAGALTGRQQVIKGLMEKGFTNSAIAAEIGYSESLVRQETMAIYTTLNLSGRKDLFQE